MHKNTVLSSSQASLAVGVAQSGYGRESPIDRSRFGSIAVILRHFRSYLRDPAMSIGKPSGSHTHPARQRSERQIQRAPESDASCRERLKAALAEVITERGYSATTLSDVAARGGISRSSFHREFSSLDDCLLETLESFAQQLQARAISGYRQVPLKPPDRETALRRALATVLGMIAHRPAQSWLSLVEARGASRPVVERCQQASFDLATLVSPGMSLPGDAPALTPAVAQAIIGGIWHVAYSHLRDDERAALPAQGERLSAWVLSYLRGPLSQALEIGGRTTSKRSRPRPTSTAAETGAKPDGQSRSTRSRILQGTAITVSARGYHEVSVADISKSAGIATRTFYRHFQNKSVCVLAAYDHWYSSTRAVAVHSYDRTDAAAEVCDVIASFVSSVEKDPEMAHLAMVDVLALGAVGRERHDRAIDDLASLLARTFEAGPNEDVALKATAGALWNALRSHALQTHTKPEEDPTASLTYIALAPFIGADAAQSIAESNTSPLRSDPPSDER